MEFDAEVLLCDISPIPQDDGSNPVVSIQYTEKYSKLMGIFRAVLVTKEYSERILHLTKLLLLENAANYTVWQYRRDCIRSIKYDLEQELDFLDTFADDNPKNYQIWHHRRCVVELFDNAHRELAFINKIFETDAKNYHAWAYRQWVVKKFKYWSDELACIDHLLYIDVRNNSAWNHRWYVVHNYLLEPSTTTNENTIKVLNSELEYVFKSINQVKYNESAWNYLRGLINTHSELIFTALPLLKGINVSGDYDENHYYLCLLAHIFEKVGSTESLEECCELYMKLLTIDSTRAKFWNSKINIVAKLLENTETV